jgi:hypothetical protein
MKSKMFYGFVVLIASGAIASLARPATADTEEADEAKPAQSATDDASATSESNESPSDATNGGSYLGVAVEPLHPSVSTHLPDVMVKGQGVLVSQVSPDSPAAKAGIEQNDILVKYGDQKLFSAEQLAKLVQADKPGQEVELGLVRGGKLQTVHATIGQAATESRVSRASHRSPTKRAASRRRRQRAADTDWESFDSLTLKRIDDQNFIAEIKYLDENGKLKSQTFKGTRDQIEQDVNAKADIPDNEREQLLNAIERPRRDVMILPRFGFDPDGDFFWFQSPDEF